MDEGAQASRVGVDWGGLARSTHRIAVLVVLLLANIYYINRTFDDAFVFFRYAENIARGQGWVYTAGERVEAYTSFTWTALLALAAALGAAKTKMGLVVVSKGLGALFGLCTVLCLEATAPLVSPHTANPWRGATALTFLALSAPFAAWGVGSLETPLAALLCVAAVRFQLSDRVTLPRRKRWPRSALLFALGALTRPEILCLFLVSAGFDLIVDLKTRRVRQNLQANLIWLAAFALPCAAHLLWRHAYYGQWLPNTYYAKVAGDQQTWVRGTSYVGSALVELGIGPCLLAAIVPFLIARRFSAQVSYLLLLTLSYLLVIALEGGDWMPAFRFVAPILPLVALLLEAGANEAYDHWPTRRARGLTATATLSLLALAVCSSFHAVRLWSLPSGFDKWSPVPRDHVDVARWMNDHLPPRQGLLALGEAGVIPYFTELPVLDLFGLADAHLAHVPGVQMHKFDLDYVLGRKPRYVLLAGKDKQGKLLPTFTYTEQLLKNERFAREYRLRQDFPAFALYERAVDDGR